jgi:uncharacterized protein YecT (DUF1311 family)
VKLRLTAALFCLLVSTSSAAQAQNQIELNAKAAKDADAVNPKVKKSMRTLSAKYASVKGFKAKLDESEELYDNFIAAHIESIFPVPKGGDYRALYGSINGLCVNEIRQELLETRLAELEKWTKFPAKTDLATLKDEYVKDDKQLNATYIKVKKSKASTGETGPTFLKNLIGAEVAWIAFRNTDSEIYGLSGGSEALKQQKMNELTKQREKQLNQWLVPPEEGDTCAGSR